MSTHFSWKAVKVSATQILTWKAWATSWMGHDKSTRGYKLLVTLPMDMAGRGDEAVSVLEYIGEKRLKLTSDGLQRWVKHYRRHHTKETCWLRSREDILLTIVLLGRGYDDGLHCSILDTLINHQLHHCLLFIWCLHFARGYRRLRCCCGNSWKEEKCRDELLVFVSEMARNLKLEKVRQHSSVRRKLMVAYFFTKPRFRINSD